jgi:hypothetical protein
LLGLRLEILADNLAFDVERDLAGGEEPAIGDDALRIGANGFGRPIGADNSHCNSSFLLV